MAGIHYRAKGPDSNTLPTPAPWEVRQLSPSQILTTDRAANRAAQTEGAELRGTGGDTWIHPPPSAHGTTTLVPSPARISQQCHPYRKGCSSSWEGAVRSKHSEPL